MAELQVVLVSPARPVFEGAARSVAVEALEGQMGVLPGHADLVAALGTGPLRIAKPEGGEERFAVRGGFLKVGDGSRVTILVDRAVAAGEIDAAAARKGLDSVLADLRHPASDEEFTRLLDDRAWFQAQLRLA